MNGYSLGRSLMTSGDLIPMSSLVQHEEVVGMSTSSIFAAPPGVTINFKMVCTFCERLFDMENGFERVGEMKQVEEIALEHFKVRVLKVGEGESGGTIFLDGLDDGSRAKKLLDSITFCDDCVFHFARAERGILRDQMAYLEKISGVRKLEDVFVDPWLDFKRLAFHKLKCHESSIKEKLLLMEKVLPDGEVTRNDQISSLEEKTGTPAASTSSATTAHQMLLTTVNLPTAEAASANNVVNMDVSKILEPSKRSALCESTASVNGNSNRSSTVGSPKPADVENDGSNFQQPDEETTNAPILPSTSIVSNCPSHSVHPQDKIQGDLCYGVIESSEKNFEDLSSKTERHQKKNTENDEGNDSDAQSVVSVQSKVELIPAIHMSPIVRLKRISVLKTPPPSASKSVRKVTPPAASPSETPRKPLTDNEIEGILENDPAIENNDATTSSQNDDSDGESEDVVSAEQPESNREADQVQNVADEDAVMSQENKEDGTSADDSCPGNDNNPESSTETAERTSADATDDNNQERNAETTEKTSEDATDDNSQESNTETVGKTSADANIKKNHISVKSTVLEDEESESSEDVFEESEDNEEEQDSDESFVPPASSKKGKRKRFSWGGRASGNKRKKMQAKQVTLSTEKELSLSTTSTQKIPTNPSAKKAPVVPAPPASAKKQASSLSTRSHKKSNIPTSPFVTPKKRKESTSENTKGNGDGGKGKRFSVIDSAREVLGNELVETVSRRQSTRSSPRKPFPVTGGQSVKKCFTVGNRCLTEPSSSDSSDDSDDSS